MKARQTVLPILVVCTAFWGVSCGGGADNPAAPEVSAPTAATAPDDGGVDAAALRRQPWSVSDACSDGLGIQMRLWEARGNRLTGRATRILKTRSGGRISFRLLCDSATSGCLGATTNPPGSRSWGVGINAERPRVTKAYCKACTSGAVSLRLLCGRRATDAGLAWDDALDGGLMIDGGDEGLVKYED
jgi:hypothetical protein